MMGLSRFQNSILIVWLLISMPVLGQDSNKDQAISIVAMINAGQEIGSAIIVGGDERWIYLATARHVVWDGLAKTARDITVYFDQAPDKEISGEMVIHAGQTDRDSVEDIAVIRVERKAVPFVNLSIEQRLISGEVPTHFQFVGRQGQHGTWRVSPTVERDKESGIPGRSYAAQSEFMELPGFSGGPAFDPAWRLMGIVVAGLGAKDSDAGTTIVMPLAVILNRMEQAKIPIADYLKPVGQTLLPEFMHREVVTFALQYMNESLYASQITQMKELTGHFSTEDLAKLVGGSSLAMASYGYGGMSIGGTSIAGPRQLKYFLIERNKGEWLIRDEIVVTHSLEVQKQITRELPLGGNGVVLCWAQKLSNELTAMGVIRTAPSNMSAYGAIGTSEDEEMLEQVASGFHESKYDPPLMTSNPEPCTKLAKDLIEGHTPSSVSENALQSDHGVEAKRYNISTEEHLLPYGEARRLIRLGDGSKEAGKLEEAVDYYQAALPLAREAGDSLLLQTNLYQLGRILLSMNMYSDSIGYFRELLPLAQGQGSKVTFVQTVFFLGNAEWNLENFNTAKNYLEQSLSFGDELDDADVKMRPLAMAMLGIIASKQGSFDTALTYFDQSLPFIENLENMSLLAAILEEYGKVLKAKGDDTGAESHLMRALAYYQQLGRQSGILSASLQLGMVQNNLGKFDNAITNFRLSFQHAQETDNHTVQGIAKIMIGINLLQKGTRIEACAHLNEALSVYDGTLNDNLKKTGLNVVRQYCTDTRAGQ